MFKDPYPIVTPRFSDIDGIAAITRVTIKYVRTYTKGYFVLKAEEISQPIVRVKNNSYFTLWKMGGCKMRKFCS